MLPDAPFPPCPHAEGLTLLQMERARKAHYRMAAVRAVEGAAQEFGSLLLPNGEVNTDTVHRVFRLFDTDGNGHIDQSESAPAWLPLLSCSVQSPGQSGFRGWGGRTRGEMSSHVHACASGLPGAVGSLCCGFECTQQLHLSRKQAVHPTCPRFTAITASFCQQLIKPPLPASPLPASHTSPSRQSVLTCTQRC